MQTFLPYEDFEKSAACLDNKRLGKQRVECWQIYKALTEPEYGWKNHPAVLMWEWCEQPLIAYARAVCIEWRRRGFKDNMIAKFDAAQFENFPYGDDYVLPWWLGAEEIHDSHKSNLLRKDPEHYGQFGWDVPDNLEYVWPNKPLKETK